MNELHNNLCHNVEDKSYLILKKIISHLSTKFIPKPQQIENLNYFSWSIIQNLILKSNHTENSYIKLLKVFE